MRVLAILAMALVANLVSGPALALSCMRADVARSYQQAVEAHETYVVVKGVVNFDERLIPERDLNRQDARDIDVPAHFKGYSLSKAGFKTPFEREITLRLRCFGPWCGGAKSGVEYLAFLERAGAGYVMDVDPCGSLAFPEPSAKQVKQAESCMAGRGCRPEKY